VAMSESAKHLRNRQGLTPLEIACEHGPCAVFDLIQMYKKKDGMFLFLDSYCCS
jgi:hypothetical protein